LGPITPSRFIQGSKLVWNSPRTDEVVEPEHEIDENRLGADCEKASGGCYEHNGCDADQVTRPSERRIAPPDSIQRGGSPSTRTRW
jgi:hypothetical protein